MDNRPDPIEMLYIESSSLSLPEFRKRVTSLIESHTKKAREEEHNYVLGMALAMSMFDKRSSQTLIDGIRQRKEKLESTIDKDTKE